LKLWVAGDGLAHHLDAGVLSAGRSFGLSIGSLIAGILLGAALNAWLRVDIVPVGVSGSNPCCACLESTSGGHKQYMCWLHQQLRHSIL